jgi:hypothetical protein
MVLQRRMALGMFGGGLTFGQVFLRTDVTQTVSLRLRFQVARI